MSKIKFMLFIFIVLMSCKNENKDERLVFSGNVNNYNSDKMVLSRYKFQKNIMLDNEGTFNDTLTLNDGYYTIEVNREKINIYLKNGVDFNIKLNLNKPLESTINTTQNLNLINKYLLQKQDIEKNIKGRFKKLYSLNESDFLDRVKTLKQKLVDHLNPYDLPTSFKDKEYEYIEYGNLKLLMDYEYFHKQFTSTPDFKVSNKFPKNLLKGLDVNDEESYKESLSYRDLVYYYFDETAFEQSNALNKEYDFIFMDNVVNSVSNKFIKDELLYDNARYKMTSAKDLDLFYSRYMEYSSNSKHKEEISSAYKELKRLSKGELSPKFYNYENHKGGTVSLDDLKGKYVYIDLWATWCQPCKKEIPFLKKIEKKYYNKNIHFVSISLDGKRSKATWRKMVSDLNLTGIQLIADNEFSSQFIRDYKIKGIPRFILINPKGQIVTANAPRPSDDKLIDLFIKEGI